MEEEVFPPFPDTRLDPDFPVVAEGAVAGTILPPPESPVSTKEGLCTLALGLFPKRKSFRIVSVLFLSCPFLLPLANLFSGELSPPLLVTAACRAVVVVVVMGVAAGGGTEGRGRLAVVAPLVDAFLSSDCEVAFAPDLRLLGFTIGSASSSLLLALKDDTLSLDCAEATFTGMVGGVGFTGMWGSGREFEDPLVVRAANLARVSVNSSKWDV